MNTQLRIDGARLDALSQQFELAQEKVQALQSQITQTKATIVADQAQVATDQANLRSQALNAYMAGSADSGLESIFGPGGEQAVVTNEYKTLATGNLTNSVDGLTIAQAHLAQQENQLQSTEDQAQAALNQVAAAKQAAQATMNAEQATLRGLNGQISQLVAQQQQAAEAASYQAYLTRIGSSHGGSNVPAAGGAGRAVQAAESQIGVPYQWGGESPGVGFDCSGLTQWSWGQAGVSIPRTADAQYHSVAWVPLSAMEPGDLVFWGSGGYADHVAIYVGNGMVVHAPSSGQTVREQAIWSDGLLGAGRP